MFWRRTLSFPAFVVWVAHFMPSMLKKYAMKIRNSRKLCVLLFSSSQCFHYSYSIMMKDMKIRVFTVLDIGGIVLSCVSLLFSLMGHGDKAIHWGYAYFGLWNNCITNIIDLSETCRSWGKNTVL